MFLICLGPTILSDGKESGEASQVFGRQQMRTPYVLTIFALSGVKFRRKPFLNLK